ncbi:recombinase family protein [bacterium]|nr:recombinase family protein [bacterium]
MSSLLGYHRVSSASSQSLDLGREALIKAGVPEDRIYEEKVSGKSKDNRPELKAMLKAVREGDEVVVHKLDRLARNTKDLLTIVDQISKASASLKILDLGINTGTPVGKMILTVLGAVSELERSYINDRTRAGVKRYIERGGKMGPKPNAKRDKHIRALDAGGQHSWSEIAEEVGVSRQTVYRVLRPNKAKEHRVSDMTRYYKSKEKNPPSAPALSNK